MNLFFSCYLYFTWSSHWYQNFFYKREVVEVSAMRTHACAQDTWYIVVSDSTNIPKYLIALHLNPQLIQIHLFLLVLYVCKQMPSQRSRKSSQVGALISSNGLLFRQNQQKQDVFRFHRSGIKTASAGVIMWQHSLLNFWFTQSCSSSASNIIPSTANARFPVYTSEWTSWMLPYSPVQV